MCISNIPPLHIYTACDIFWGSDNVLDCIKMYGLCNESVLNLYNGTSKLLLSKCASKED